MFENLTERLGAVFSRLTGRGALSEADVDEAMREVRLALLEADVHFKVVKEFVAKVRERAVGVEVLKSLTPGQTVVKIVAEELTTLLGGTQAKLALAGRKPNKIMLVGLQGSGKTTTAAKLANMLRKDGRKPLLVACDVYRPAAIDQLVALGAELGIPVYRGEGTDPVAIAQAGVRDAIDRMCDIVIVDTAGRLHVDDEMMDEAARIKSAVKPDQVLMVVDAMTGQDAVTAAKAFHERVAFDGVIVTKLDGDARGGAALSVKAVTGSPILFVGVSEKLDGIEPFHPDRMARRILGMGDMLTLIEKAQETVEADDATRLEAQLKAGTFTLDDFASQLKQLKKMGSMRDILGMLPGGGGMKMPDDAELDPKAIDRIVAIVSSMTPRERTKPSLINGARRTRIASGSGVTVTEVNRLLKQFDEVRRLVKRMGTQPGKRRKFSMPGMGGGFRPPV